LHFTEDEEENQADSEPHFRFDVCGVDQQSDGRGRVEEIEFLVRVRLPE